MIDLRDLQSLAFYRPLPPPASPSPHETFVCRRRCLPNNHRYIFFSRAKNVVGKYNKHPKNSDKRRQERNYNFSCMMYSKLRNLWNTGIKKELFILNDIHYKSSLTNKDVVRLIFNMRRHDRKGLFPA